MLAYRLKKDEYPRMRSAWPFIVIAGLLAGCPGGDDGGATSSDAGRDDAGGTLVLTEERDVRIALGSADLPYMIGLGMTPMPNTGPCPVTTKSAGGWVSEGGCTDNLERRFEGRVEVEQTKVAAGVAYVFRYDGFAMTAANFSVVVDGTISATVAQSDCGYPGPSPLETDDLRVTATGQVVEGFGGYFPGDGEPVTLSFTDYTLSWDLKCAPGTITASGRVEVVGRGDYTFDMAHAGVETCEARDSLEGSLVINAADKVTVSYDGASACDGCLLYASNDSSLTGSLCWL